MCVCASSTCLSDETFTFTVDYNSRRIFVEPTEVHQKRMFLCSSVKKFCCATWSRPKGSWVTQGLLSCWENLLLSDVTRCHKQKLVIFYIICSNSEKGLPGHWLSSSSLWQWGATTGSGPRRLTESIFNRLIQRTWETPASFVRPTWVERVTSILNERMTSILNSRNRKWLFPENLLWLEKPERFPSCFDPARATDHVHRSQPNFTQLQRDSPLFSLECIFEAAAVWRQDIIESSILLIISSRSSPAQVSWQSPTVGDDAKCMNDLLSRIRVTRKNRKVNDECRRRRSCARSVGMVPSRSQHNLKFVSGSYRGEYQSFVWSGWSERSVRILGG